MFKKKADLKVENVELVEADLTFFPLHKHKRI